MPQYHTITSILYYKFVLVILWYKFSNEIGKNIMLTDDIVEVYYNNL